MKRLAKFRGMYSKRACFVLLIGLLGTVTGSFKSFGLEIAFQSKKIKGKSLWQYPDIPDLISCAIFCLEDKKCRTYSYSSTTCTGYPRAVDFYKNSLEDVKTGIQVFRTNRVEHAHGERCNQKEECIMESSLCFKGRCLCQPGLYFSPTDNGCLRFCFRFGKGVDQYKEIGIDSHNLRNYENITSFESCWEKCLQEQDFQCRTIEWWTKGLECKLGYSGYLDVDKKDREAHAPLWIFGQRQCM